MCPKAAIMMPLAQWFGHSDRHPGSELGKRRRAQRSGVRIGTQDGCTTEQESDTGILRWLACGNKGAPVTVNEQVPFAIDATLHYFTGERR